MGVGSGGAAGTWAVAVSGAAGATAGWEAGGSAEEAANAEAVASVAGEAMEGLGVAVNAAAGGT